MNSGISVVITQRVPLDDATRIPDAVAVAVSAVSVVTTQDTPSTTCVAALSIESSAPVQSVSMTRRGAPRRMFGTAVGRPGLCDMRPRLMLYTPACSP